MRKNSMSPQEREIVKEASRPVWETLTRLVSPDPDLRRKALEALPQLEGYPREPLLVYLLATRLTDPDLEIRLQAVRMLGGLLGREGGAGQLGRTALEYLAGYLAGLEISQYVSLLEVSAAYLAAEKPLSSILKMCSYAGKSLSGIVNDQKLPVNIRQQAVFFCGEIGFLNTAPALKALIQRVEKDRGRADKQPGGRISQDRESLYLPALAALSKLEG